MGIMPPLPTYILIVQRSSESSVNKEDSLRSNHDHLAFSGRFSFDVIALKKKLREFEEESYFIRTIGNLLFVTIFLGLPVILWTGTIALYWRPLLILFLYLWILGIGGFLIAHRRLFRDESRQRLKRTLLIGISPLGAIRSANQLSKDLLRNFHPVAACYELCPRDDFERNARMAYYDEVNSPNEHKLAATSLMPGAMKSLHNCHIAKFLMSIGYLEQLLKSPTPEDSLCINYCPRCHCQYRAEAKTCNDCESIPLTRIS